MMLNKLEEEDLGKIILIGDKVLVKPKLQHQKTKPGLYLPPGVQEKEKIATGYIVKVGPGYPIPIANDIEEPWKDAREEVRYVPIQPREGDLAVYLQNSSYEIEFNNEKYVIISNHSILMLVRDEGLFE